MLQSSSVRNPCISISVLLIQLKTESSFGVYLPLQEHSFPYHAVNIALSFLLYSFVMFRMLVNAIE